MGRPRKAKGRNISGWVILDKPIGMGSTQAVSKIKWLFGAQKAGHAGTLDPLASGLLPIALGEATKTVPYVMEGSKVYQFQIAWGQERDTDDLEGEATHHSPLRPTEEQVLALLPKYIGEILQTPPQYSAIKIDGARAYDLAREGETIDIPARKITIYSLKLIKNYNNESALFEVVCGKGTYVRALTRDIGRDLGCYGHIIALRRIEVAPFTQEDFVRLEELEAASPKADGIEAPAASALDFSAIDGLLIETGAALDCLSKYELSQQQAHKVRMGNAVLLRGHDIPLDEDEVCVSDQGGILAIGSIDKGTFKPKRVFTGN